ncbi:hypothetical protein JG688_00011766 [Phytophthora aleatoria]|uniref:Uncharacterized protein n=1 Tax=Phytophthora aleatoria TaxID=2496075 RepID=A0A8J5M527_9STRA|nr:hypothetical protein JG688_00011766 [Phytophthora aleatoria]
MTEETQEKGEDEGQNEGDFSYAGFPDTEIPLVPEEYEMYQRKYICTHGWLQRERTSGKRTTHNLRGMMCPFQFLAQLQQRGDTWVFVLKRESYIYNHPVSNEIYMNYPGIRQVPSNSALIPGIKLLVENTCSSYYDYTIARTK